jgi:hypothetical protein
MTEDGESYRSKDEQVMELANAAWDEYGWSHNGQPGSLEHGWLMWERVRGGWLQMSRDLVADDDGAYISECLTIDLRDAEAILEAHFDIAEGEPIEPNLGFPYPSEDTLAEIAELLASEPLASEEAIESFRKRYRANLARVLVRGDIIIAPDINPPAQLSQRRKVLGGLTNLLRKFRT